MKKLKNTLIKISQAHQTTIIIGGIDPFIIKFI